MNHAELRAAIARTGKSKRELAAALHVSQRTLNNKMAGRSQFKVREIQGLTRELGLDLESMSMIFFGPNVN